MNTGTGLYDQLSGNNTNYYNKLSAKDIEGILETFKSTYEHLNDPLCIDYDPENYNSKKYGIKHYPTESYRIETINFSGNSTITTVNI